MEIIVLVLMYMYFVLISSSRFLGLFHKKEIPELFFFGLGCPVVFFLWVDMEDSFKRSQHGLGIQNLCLNGR
jgi:hypothetical protein